MLRRFQTAVSTTGEVFIYAGGIRPTDRLVLIQNDTVLDLELKRWDPIGPTVC